MSGGIEVRRSVELEGALKKRKRRTLLECSGGEERVAQGLRSLLGEGRPHFLRSVAERGCGKKKSIEGFPDYRTFGIIAKIKQKKTGNEVRGRERCPPILCGRRSL